MSRDMLTVGSTMRIPLLFRGEYSQWSERFMNYLEEQTDREAMINSIKNGDQPLPTVTQVSIAGATSSEQPPLKDKSMCNETAKDLCDALERHMLCSEYGSSLETELAIPFSDRIHKNLYCPNSQIEHHIQAQRTHFSSSSGCSLSLTPFYQAFLITSSVLVIYMHEFWATVTFQKHNIKFKMNKKSYSFDLETFKDMFQICPKVPDQKFIDPSFEEEILAFMYDLGYLGNIKTLSEVKVKILPQPCRTFGTIIKKCLSAYKTYYAFATGKAIPKPKYVRRSVKEKSKQALKASFGKRIKSAAKVTTRSRKKKQIAEGLETLSEVALSEVEQMKLAIERCKTQLHISQPNGSGAHEGTGVTPGSLVMMKMMMTKQAVQTPYHVGSTDDEDIDEEIQGVNVDADKLDEEETNEEDEGDELYRDVNVNLEGRDIEMTDAQQTNSSSVSSGFVSNMLNPSPDTGVDFIFNLNTESTSLVDVSVTSIAETPLLSATTLPLPPTSLISHLQQTPAFTPITVPSSSLQDLPNFGSLFGFTHKLKTLEIDFSEFKQTNQFATAVSLIPGIVDLYLANKINEAIKTAV
nr:hypothetical protein [Tanacetum cinerariifolium]